MITQSHIDHLVAMAGPGFTWCGTRSSRPPSGVARPIRAGLLDFLQTYANSTCAFCGEYAPIGDACHIVSGGAKRNGYLPGNLAYGDRACNEIDAARDATVIDLASIARPDLVPVAWPTVDDLAMRGSHALALVEEAKRRKRALRGL